MVRLLLLPSCLTTKSAEILCYLHAPSTPVLQIRYLHIGNERVLASHVDERVLRTGAIQSVAITSRHPALRYSPLRAAEDHDSLPPLTYYRAAVSGRRVFIRDHKR